ncbi:hypothetical protein CFP65_4029 [Kitasatospora sp. MMS16-BH015]|uniref:YqcI/YcgG family protein n=1 Tax=Kitasatospora sp. MMS16-BH015 TaxID=2018025 RepID=UPI000CA3A4E2|nr:YqcI/YcgG family protein [Kitasatospora sp. MMS16-BH015]AUG78796.1 hypothetical protein CFP65_4029 [Kitasatospora sp. MMS16-BH015]
MADPHLTAPSDAVRAMEPIVNGTLCPFATKARLRGAPCFDPLRTLRENLEDSVEPLLAFSRDAEREGLDGFLYRFPAAAVGTGVEELGELVRLLVDVLAEADPVCPAGRDRAEILGGKWRFRFAGIDYFLAVFSPVYGADHSRSTFGITDSVFLMMQPNSSFHARLGAQGRKTRAKIRAKFTDAHGGYPSYETEAFKFVLPLRHEDPPVEWYDAEISRLKVAG